MPKYFQDGNGRIKCTKHIGHYATTTLAKNSSAKTIDTPTTAWHLLNEDQIALTSTFNPFICESCNSSTEMQVASLPVIEFPDSEDTKGLRALIKTTLVDFPDIDAEFSDYCKQNTNFSYKQATNLVAKEQWLAFVATKQVVVEPEPVPETKIVVVAKKTIIQEEIVIPLEEDDEKILIRHQLVYNGQSVRDQKVRLQDRIDVEYDAEGNPTGEDGYTRWLASQPIERWLQSVRDEYEHSEYISNPIPFDKPLLVKVNWLPKVEYVSTETPTLNNKGELRVSKKQTLIIRGKAAQNSNSRKSSSPLDFNAQEQTDIYNQDLFYPPYIPSKSDGKYTMEDGQEIDVVRIEMVLGTELVPNHLWSSCSIQSYDAATKTTTTHFSWTKAPRKDQPEKEAKQFPKRNGFEGFQAIMRDGGFSDPFTTHLYKLRPDGVPMTLNGKSVVHESVVRFRIATAQLTHDKVENTKDGLRSTFKGSSDTAKGAQYNKSVDKTNRIWLDIYNKDGSWSGKPILLGNAHFSSMEPIYD